MRTFVIVCLLGPLVACGGSSSTSPSNSSGTGGGSGGGTALSCPAFLGIATRAQGTFTATINGASWRADCIGVKVAASPGGLPDIIAISGADLATGVTYQTFGFATSRAVGTTTIGETSGLNATLSSSAGVWLANPQSGSGTVTFTTVTSNSVAGSFSFAFPPGSTASLGSRTVTGSLSLTY